MLRGIAAPVADQWQALLSSNVCSQQRYAGPDAVAAPASSGNDFQLVHKAAASQEGILTCRCQIALLRRSSICSLVSISCSNAWDGWRNFHD